MFINFLSDDWRIEGNDFNEFKKNLDEFSRRTRFNIKNMNEFQFLNISSIGTELSAFPLHAASLWRKTKASFSLPMFSVDEESLSKCFDESIRRQSLENGLFVAFSKGRLGLAQAKKSLGEGKYIPISAMALNTVSNRVKLSGYNFSNPGLVRDLSVAHYFSNPVPVYSIERQEPESGKSKVFAIMSNKYSKIPQEMILEIIKGIMDVARKDLGIGICKNWVIDHSTTKIYINFPEYGKQLADEYEFPEEFTPGIMLETSDVGDSSLRVKGYFDFGGAMTFMEHEYSQIHSGVLDMNEMLKEISNKIFPEYRVYPEKLASFMMIDITTSSMPEKEKIKVLSDLYKDISKTIGLVKAIKKKKEKVLMEKLIAEINPDLNYTAYDIVERFLTLPKSIEVENKSIIEAISKVTKKVFDYEFEEECLLVM